MDSADEKKLSPVSSPDLEVARNSSVDPDALKLAEMGYTQDLSRNFSVWSVLGVGFSLTNSWFGISAALITGINSGGPILIIYGIILMALISTCVGISLSELASAFPNAGGQYFWANELAPKRFTNLASYLTGWLAWWGSMFTSASVALAMGSALVGCYQLSHPDFVIKTWHVFVAYQMANIFCFFFNCYGKTLPMVAQTTLWTSLISFAVILITVPAVAPTHQHAKFVFATFINNTGWQQGGIAFIVGLVNTNWSFACLDCATHLAEEVHRPEKMIPIAIMGTVGIGFVTSWFFSMAMFFSIVGDFADILTTATLVPILEVFYQALNHRAGAIVLESLIIATGLGCLVASHTWQSRLCWSFARDRGLPAHRWLAKVHPRLDVPLNAHFVSCVIVAIMGCLYLASLTAFNSMITACIVLLYLSYAIPVICLLIRGRSNIKPGPFWLGSIGLFSNIVLLMWTLFTLVMYSFPYAKPVAASNMNYVCVVYAVVTLITGLDWVFRGRKSFRGVGERHADVSAHGHVVDVPGHGYAT
ncbi:choline transport protein [Paraphoma chrysanthemicola]|uniref:Choline transport protein n=1 Tax=Paraphoma chrysanthemicola TaxID=798071 RepID=A0A8K0W1Y7_9PLEO|nr:choline transport protein [Paraphoma chrysanthemicola]